MLPTDSIRGSAGSNCSRQRVSLILFTKAIGPVLCGQCGRRMCLSYGGSGRSRVYQYRCSRARAQQGGSDCQVIGGKRIDQTVVEVFLEATTPCAADAARLANEEAHRESEALRLYWAHQIERVQYEAQRAERQYMAVEPENRVVARELERRWEQALKELERVRSQLLIMTVFLSLWQRTDMNALLGYMDEAD